MAMVGDRIKTRRQELRMSQRDLAEVMGYSNHSTIARIEAGKVDLPQSRILQFAKVLGTTPAHLMGLENTQPEDIGALAARVLMDPAVLDMVQKFMELGESDKFMVTTLVDGLHAKIKKD